MPDLRPSLSRTSVSWTSRAWRRRANGVGLALALLAGGSVGRPAQAEDKAPPAVTDEAGEAVPSGERYVGLVPGGGSKNPLPLPTPVPPQLVWTGFRMKDGGSEVFLQTTRTVEHELKAIVPPRDGKPGRLTVFLRNCRIHLQNNRRSLDTRFFSTPVAEVKARQRRKDVELEIVLKEPVSPQPRTEAGADGTHLLVLEFPPSKAQGGPVADGSAAGPAAAER